ncbi:MAG: polymerase subunit sigma-70 [Mucilaginibacter sp.]|nr:polymerase subunit sigma-70 [Mucilaginibacter sp.]
MAAFGKFTDNELTFLLKDGDHAAFEEIFKRYNKLLFLYAFKKLQDRELAKDLVQDVFTWLWDNHRDYNIKTTLCGYLYKTVLNKVFDIFKHNEIISKYVDSGAYYINIDNAQTDYLIREKDIALLVDQEIATMPPRMREIFELKHKQFYTTKDIAGQLEISEHTVSTQLKRALKHLRIRLGTYVYLLFIINSLIK